MRTPVFCEKPALSYGLLLPRSSQCLGIQTLLQCIFSVLIYQFIVQRRGSATAFLVGFGIILPLSLAVPFELLEYYDVQNKVVKFSFCTLATILFFRTIEAMYGTSPDGVESSQGTYIAYFSSVMHFEWDPQTKKRRRITWNELGTAVARILLHFFLICLMLSWEMHHNFQPFPSNVTLDEFTLSFQFLTPSHLANAYCLGVLTYLFLFTGFELTAFNENIKGIYTKPIFLNPLFTSRSPTDFWGEKWNLVIHRILKHGVYLPARQLLVSSHVAIALTFVASGLLHDYAWLLIFYPHKHIRDESGVCSDCWTPVPLKITAFFCWNGAITLLERPLTKYFTWTRDLPTVVVSTLVILTALPVSHWYSGDWAVGGVYSDFCVALFHIRKLSPGVVFAK